MIEIKIVAIAVLYAVFATLWVNYFIEKAVDEDWCTTKSMFVIALPFWLPAVLALLFL